MRYGFFSDVHSNLEAFETALNYYNSENIDRFIFLGDIVGYGPDPNGCIELLKDIKPKCVAGNHDWAITGKTDINFFTPYAKEAIIWTEKQLQENNRQYLEFFNLIYTEDDFICVHGSLVEPESFYYLNDISDAQDNFSLLKKKIWFVGHSHRLETYCQVNQDISKINNYEINLKENRKYIINVGSIGQPQDADWRASLCIYDDNKNMVIFKRLQYNVKKTAEKILQYGLPSILAMRLFDGY